MSWLLMTFDEPHGPKEKWGAYVEKRNDWFTSLLEDSGWKELRVLIDAAMSSPTSYVFVEFANFEDIHSLIYSEKYIELTKEFRAIGGTNLKVKIMKKSLSVPEPIGPEDI